MMRFVYQASLFAASSFSKYCSDGVSHSVSLAWVSSPLSCEQTGSMSQLFPSANRNADAKDLERDFK